ncbi:MAG: hypothetical protein KF900_12585 [Bacteroidetes bacterium]|nr:hypothetical protein [Bacteroidota bacterium]
MSKTILVPTDFHVESLNILKLALGSSSNHTDKVNVILMYSVDLSNSFQDLIFYSPQKIIGSAVKPEFQDALAILKNRFEKTIDALLIDVFHGYSNSAFINFAKAKNVDEVFIPKSYKFNTSGKSFCPVSLIKKSGIPFCEMDWEVKNNVSERNQLETLFNNLNPAL